MLANRKLQQQLDEATHGAELGAAAQAAEVRQLQAQAERLQLAVRQADSKVERADELLAEKNATVGVAVWLCGCSCGLGRALGRAAAVALGCADTRYQLHRLRA